MKTLVMILALIAALALAGCGDDITNILAPDDLTPPLGLNSITGDGDVTLVWWTSNFDSNLLGYKVYFAEGSLASDPVEGIPVGFTAIDSFEVVSPAAGQEFLTINGLTNGTTYSFLVVAAKDEWNNISHTSNVIAETPRPETAVAAVITSRQDDATTAGFELSDFTVVDCTDLVDYTTTTGGDIMAEAFNPGAGHRLWLDGINGAEIQDIGFMSDWDNADVAPSGGYAEPGHSVEALFGHVYAVKTADDRYAKVQITGLDIEAETVTFKAAYQMQVGNPDYK